MVSNKEERSCKDDSMQGSRNNCDNDIQGQEDLKNAQLRRQQHNYAEVLEKPVRSVLGSLAALASALAALVQSTTNMRCMARSHYPGIEVFDRAGCWRRVGQIRYRRVPHCRRARSWIVVQEEGTVVSPFLENVSMEMNIPLSR